MSVYEDLQGNGWTRVSPPSRLAEESVIAEWNGEPIRKGVEIDRIEDSIDCFHTRYRTGEYNIDMKIDADGGWVKVE